MFTDKYRPSKFSDFIGNESVIQGLLNSFPNWPQAFLIIGPPGVGKTTLGRLIAKQLECLDCNLREIDAGQDRGIDKIRETIKTVYHRPLVGNTRVYIFDECQGLTAEAQQALLKITEEAPKGVYFVFCSTDPQKIIKTLRARCEQGLLNLFPLERREIAEILKRIADAEGIKIEGEIKKIATLCVDNSDGIPRIAVMLFGKYYEYESAEKVALELKNAQGFIKPEIWDATKALESGDRVKFIELFETTQRGNYEQYRITMGHIYKKRMMNLLKNPVINKEKIEQCKEILSLFVLPVDNQLGDIELMFRFGRYFTR